MKAFANGLKRFMAVIFTVVLIADLVPAEALVMNIYATESGSVAAGDTSGDNVDYSDGGSASDNENNDSNTSGGGSSTESENDDSNTSGGGTSSDNGNDSSTTSGNGNDTESNDSNVTNGGDNSGSTTGKDEFGTTGKTDSNTDSGSVTPSVTPAGKTPTPKKPILGAPAAGFNASINALAPENGVTETKVNDKITIQAVISIGKGTTVYYKWSDNTEEQVLLDNKYGVLSNSEENRTETISIDYYPSKAGTHNIALFINDKQSTEDAVSEDTVFEVTDKLELKAPDNISTSTFGSQHEFSATLTNKGSYDLVWTDENGSVLNSKDIDDRTSVCTYTANVTNVEHTITVTANPKEGTGITGSLTKDYKFTPTPVSIEDIVDTTGKNLNDYQDGKKHRFKQGDEGNDLVFNFNNDEPKAGRTYSVTYLSPDGTEFVPLACAGDDDTIYKMPTKSVGQYFVSVECESADPNSDPASRKKSATISYTVFDRLELKQIKDFEKITDGTTNVTIRENEKLTDYFELIGFSNKEDKDLISFELELSAVKYSELKISDELTMTVNLENIRTVYSDGTETDLYAVTDVITTNSNSIKCTAPLETFDTTEKERWDAPWDGEEKITVYSGEKGDLYKNHWFNAKWTLSDKQLIQLPAGAKFINKDYETVESINAEIDTDSGSGYNTLALDDVYINAGDAVYGPVVIVYQYDNIMPQFGGITVDPYESSGVLKDKLKEKPGVKDNSDYSITTDGAIIVTNGQISIFDVKTIDEDGDSDLNEGYVFVSTTKYETVEELVENATFDASSTITDTGTYYVYTKHVDRAGNTAYRSIDGTLLSDSSAPKADVSLTLNNVKNGIAEYATLTVNKLSDEGSGLYDVTYYLYDEGKTYVSASILKNKFSGDRFLYNKSYSPDKLDLGDTTISNAGSKLSLVVSVSDWAGNTTYYGYNGNKDLVEVDINKFNKEDPTFCIAKAAKVKVDFGKDNPIVRNGNDYIFTSDMDDWATRTSGTISFSNMPVSTFTYKWNGPEQTISAKKYDSDKHCYTFDAIALEAVSDGKNELSINLNGSIAINSSDSFANITKGETTSYSEAFICDSTNPVVDMSVDKKSAYSVKENGAETFYYGLTKDGESGYPEFTVTATITEDNWYQVDVPKLVVYKDGEINQTADFDFSKKTASVTIEGDKDHNTTDGKYQFKVEYVDSGKASAYHNFREVHDGDNESDGNYLTPDIPIESKNTYVIDTIRPKVTYSISDTDCNIFDEIAYYNIVFTETFSVNELNIGDEKNSTIEIIKYYQARPESDTATPSYKITDKAPELSFSPTVTNNNNEVKPQDGIYSYEIKGTDLAGNKLQFVKDTTATEQDKTSLSDADKEGVFKTQLKVLDTTVPKVTYSITELNDTHFYKEADYYRNDFTVTFVVNELNFYENGIVADGFDRTDNGDDHTYQRNAEKEGEYTFSISGEDKAGNPIEVTKEEPNKSADPESGKGEYTTHKKVLDRTAPVYKVKEMTEPESAENVEGDRAYFKKNVSTTFIVEDKYLDEGKVQSKLTSNTAAADYAHDNVTWTDIELSKTDNSTTSVTRSVTASQDGLHRFEVAGEDKAGNKLVRAKKCDINDKTYNKTEPHGDGNGEFWTMIKVIDTVAPQGEITIGKYYIADLKAPKVLEVKTSEPYRKETSASGTVKVTNDHSPVKIAYPLTSQVGGRSQGKLFGDYKYNNSVSFSTQGEQVFFLTVTLTDRAGNTTGPIKTNSIYLDVTPPTEDTLAPSISIVANANSSAHGPAGNPLFSSSVPISVVVSDPNATARSSGLAEISYEILVDGQVKNTGILNQKGTTKWNGKYNDPSLTYKISKSVTADSSLNSNNIVIRVKAADNSGNTSQKEYNFGIDITAPKISVTYDNNDVQNEKYFKADRTATIVVTERNFDPSRINITTNGGSQSDWSFSNNGGNGDNDTWTKRITYGSDGDYTLGVNGSDLLGHQASDITYNGAAPREFTVDKTIPVITISFDIGQGYKGSKYFNETRTGTVTIFEHNFRASDARVDSPGFISRGEQPSASQGGWSDNGDNHYMSIVFDQDGDYTITANYTDLAGNVALVATADEFTIDKTKPEIEFDSSTVQANHAYQGVIAPRIIFSDTNYDPEGVTFTLTGIKDSRGKVLKLTEVFSDETGYGGSISYENFANIRANDDIYTATGIIVDRAGNQSEVTITFSVNRFGSTWDYNDDKTTEGLIHRYTNEEKDVFLREINVNEVTEYSIFMTHDSDVVELKEGTDYEVNASEATGWKQYVYKFYKKNFEAEGTYNIVVQTKDAAGNSNTNSSMKNENGSEAVPLQYSIDKTCPYATLDGVDLDEKLYNQAALDLFVKVFDALSGVYKVEIFIYPHNAPEDAAERTAPAYKYENTEKDNALERVLLANNDEIPFTIGQHNSPQTVKVVTYDAAGNISEMIHTSGQTVKGEILWDGVLVSTNVASQVFYNRPLFIGLIAVLLLLLLILFLIWRRRKNQENLAG